MEKRVAVLQGDGIGPEVTSAAVRILEAIGRRFQPYIPFWLRFYRRRSDRQV